MMMIFGLDQTRIIVKMKAALNLLEKSIKIHNIKEGENQIVGEEINIEMQTLNKERNDKSKQDVHKII